MSYELHPIETIEGIGVAYGAQMEKVYIKNCEDLIKLPIDKIKMIAGMVKGISFSQMKEFKIQAIFLQIDGFGKQLSEAVAKSRIQNLIGFSSRTPENVLTIFEEAKLLGVIQNLPTILEINEFQKKAIRLNYTGRISGKVLSNKEPVKDAMIISANFSAKTNSEGKFWLPNIPFGKRKIAVKSEGYKSKIITLDIAPESANQFNFNLIKGADQPIDQDEAKGSSVRSVSPLDKFVFTDISKGEITEKAPYVVISQYTDGDYKLNSVHRKKTNTNIEIKRIRMSSDLMPNNCKKGDIVRFEKGMFVVTADTLLGIRSNVRFKKLIEKGIAINL